MSSAAVDRLAMTAAVSREPQRATSVPDSGSATTEPSAMASSSRPSADGFKPSLALTWGMREAQLAKPNPDTANTR